MNNYPNFETTIPAYKAIKRIGKFMPYFDISKIKVRYTTYQEYLEVEVSNEAEFNLFLKYLYASGEFVEGSKTQKIMNLGGFEYPIDEFGAPSSSPSCFVAYDGSFVIADLDTMKMVNTHDLKQYPFDHEHSFHTHIVDFIDAVGQMNKLAKVMDISNLMIVEIANGRII